MKILTCLLMFFAVNNVCHAQTFIDRYGLLKSAGREFDTYVLIIKSDARDSQLAESIYEFSFDKNRNNLDPVSSGAGWYRRINGDFRKMDIVWDTQNGRRIREKARIEKRYGELVMRIVESNGQGRANRTLSSVSVKNVESRVQKFVQWLVKERPTAFADKQRTNPGPLYWDIIFDEIEHQGRVNDAYNKILNGDR